MSSQPKYILVMSGKGGVGKSTVAANIARALKETQPIVGILDLDLTGPSIPTIFGMQKDKIGNRGGRMIPKCQNGIEVVSLGMMLNDPNDPIIWRGPRKHSMVAQFFESVSWNAQYVVVDLPPGTSDEHMSTINILNEKKCDFTSIIVSTPSLLALADVRKEIDLLKKLNAPILGIVENFSGIMCPCCTKINELQGKSALESLSSEYSLPHLSKVPFMPEAAQNADKGERNESFLQLFVPIVSAITEWSA